MGVTVDLIPRLPGEDPERAIARIYEGGVALRWDGETESMVIELIDSDGERIEEAPPGAFDPWRAEVRRRLADLHPWLVEIDGTRTFLWSRNCSWQFEIDDDADSITLRARRGWDPDPDLPILDDAELLEAFDGLCTILHWPDAYGSWCDLDDPDDRPTPIG